MMLGSSSIKIDDTINSEACVGERVLSLRSLLKPFQINNTTSALAAAPFINLVPFGVPVAYNIATSPIPALTGDLYTMLSSIFLFSRGSIRYKVVLGSSNASYPTSCYTCFLPPSTSLQQSIVAASANILGNVSYVTDRLTTPSTMHLVNQNLHAEFEIPQYHFTHSRLNSDHFINANLPYNVNPQSNATPLGLTMNVTTSSNVNASSLVLYRAGGEDTNFGRFISIGPIWFSTVRTN
jgi:hypothetical protein